MKERAKPPSLRLSIKSQTGKSRRKLAFIPFWQIGRETEFDSPYKCQKDVAAQLLLPYCANAALPYPMYADGRRLLVFVPFLTAWQRVKKVF